MADVRKLRPAYAASGERMLPKAAGPSMVPPVSDEAVGMSWSRSHRHWSRRAAARNRVSITQNALCSLRIFSGTSGVRAIWMKRGLPSFSRGEQLVRCRVVVTVAFVGFAEVSLAVGSDEGVELLKAVSLLCQRIGGAGEIQREVSDVEGIRRWDGAGQGVSLYRRCGDRESTGGRLMLTIRRLCRD